MPNIAAVFKQEIVRIARREIRAVIIPLRKAGASNLHQVAALKRELAATKRELAALQRSLNRQAKEEQPQPSVRFSARGLKTHRAKLNLSAADYGLLAGGISGQSIYRYEAGHTPRRAQIAALAAIRSLGKREAAARLEAASKRKK